MHFHWTHALAGVIGLLGGWLARAVHIRKNELNNPVYSPTPAQVDAANAASSNAITHAVVQADKNLPKGA